MVYRRQYRRHNYHILSLLPYEGWIKRRTGSCVASNLRILVYSVVYDSGYVFLEHRLLAWYPFVEPSNPESVMGDNLYRTYDVGP